LDLLRALVLGILQGATEFLPISSSGHLVLVPWWLGWDEPPLVFDVVLHMGTLVAVLVYFWRDWLTLLRAGLRALQHRTFQDPDARLLLLLIVGTIPAALAGVLLEGLFESAFSDPPLVAGFLLVTALLLFLCERAYTADRTLTDLTSRDALIIGLAQAFAIFPGISRSGSTIAAGIWRGLPRGVSARFSFLLGTPIIAGAGAKQVLDLLTGSLTIEQDMAGPMIVGFLAAAVVGFGCIWFLLRLLQRRRLIGFAVYCAAFGALSLLVALFS
jgi:undecaprenyl-diphosphatase